MGVGWCRGVVAGAGVSGCDDGGERDWKVILGSLVEPVEVSYYGT